MVCMDELCFCGFLVSFSFLVFFSVFCFFDFSLGGGMSPRDRDEKLFFFLFFLWVYRC